MLTLGDSVTVINDIMLVRDRLDNLCPHKQILDDSVTTDENDRA